MSQYNGPTSGRIRIGADGEVTSKTYTDPPLTADEARAVADFTELSPNAQLREVRRLKWNLAEAERRAGANLERAERSERQVDELTRKIAEFTPEGLVIPASAATILAVAAENGWSTAKMWVDRRENFGDHLFGIRVGRDGGWSFLVKWSVAPGFGRTVSGLARTPDRPQVHTAPSLRVIHDTITANPVRKEGEK